MAGFGARLPHPICRTTLLDVNVTAFFLPKHRSRKAARNKNKKVRATCCFLLKLATLPERKTLQEKESVTRAIYLVEADKNWTAAASKIARNWPIRNVFILCLVYIPQGQQGTSQSKTCSYPCFICIMTSFFLISCPFVIVCSSQLGPRMQIR